MAEEAQTVPEAKVEETKAESESKPDEAQPKGPEYEGVVKGKYQWDTSTSTKTDADDWAQGEAISKYGWSDGKKTVSIYVELPGLDDLADDAFTSTSGEKEASLSINFGKKVRSLKLSGLSNEIDGVKHVRKPGKNTVVLKLQKKEEAPWFKLLDSAKSGGDEEDDGGMGGMGGMGGLGGMGGMGGMDMASMMGGMGGGMGGMDMASMMGGMGMGGMDA